MGAFFASTLGPGAGAEPRNAASWSGLVSGAAAPAGAWSVPEAFLALLVCAVTCDGEAAEVEKEELMALAHRSRALRSLSPAELMELSATVSRRLSRDANAIPAACAALPEAMRLPTFAHALDLVLADGELTVEEADFLNALILNLKLDREGVSRITDAIVLKNQV